MGKIKMISRRMIKILMTFLVFLCLMPLSGLRTTYASVSGNAAVSVVIKNKIDISGSFPELPVGDKVKYESEDKKTASVNRKGMVKGKGEGSCGIIRKVFRDGTWQDGGSVSVNVVVPKTKDASPQMKLSFGKMHDIRDFLAEGGATGSYSTDKKGKKLISLDESGRFYPLGEGTAKITARYGKYRLKFRLRIDGIEETPDDIVFSYGVFLGAEQKDVPAMKCYKTIVLDAQYYDASVIKELRDSGHTVYSYINVGSIENFRPYYNKYVGLTLGAYENWDEERWIDVSKKEWQDFLLTQLAPEILEKGVDGFFVDNTDVYYNYERDEIFDGLTTILKGLKATGAYVSINGGDTYVMKYAEKNGSLDGIMDAVNQETVFSAINWIKGTFYKNPASEHRYFREYVEAVAGFGKDVYLLEYTTDPDLIAQVREYCRDRGFIYYASSTLELLAPGNPQGSQTLVPVTVTKILRGVINS